MKKYINLINTTALLGMLMLPWQQSLGQEEKAKPAGLNQKEILKLASVTLSNKPEQKPFILVLEVNLDEMYQLSDVIGWKAPGQTRYFRMDPRDDTPVAFTLANETFVYDAFNSVFYSLEGDNIQCVFKIEDAELKYMSGAPANRTSIDVDFGSMLRKSNLDVVTTMNEDGSIYTYAGKSEKKNRCRAVIIPKANIPLRRIELYGQKEDKPNLTTSVVGGPSILEGNFFDSQAEDLKRFKKKLQELNIEIKPVLANMETASMAVTSGIVYRSAIKNPQLRAQLPPKLKGNHDWKKLAEKDAIISKALREIFANQIKKTKEITAKQ